MTRAAFLDRDGVINQKAPEGQYVTSWGDFHFLPRIAESIALLNALDFSVVVVTNQRCVAKGLMALAELEEMHRRMSESLRHEGAVIDAVYYCPHDYEAACDCRKPAPGMLLQAARERGIQLRESWMIGDSDIDVQAGQNAGCRTAKISADGSTIGRNAAQGGADIVVPSVLDAVREILRLEGISVDSLKAHVVRKVSI